jgi:exo-beta-1,3-glucanase (GH17 family)
MKPEIKNIIMDMLSDAGINTCDTAEDFTWLFTVVKGNNEQLRTYFKTATYNTTGDYNTTFFVNGLRAIITTWLDNDCTDSVEQMNEIVMREYKKLFEE